MNLPYRIVQATLGACDGAALAAAVSEAGGLGTLTLHRISTDEAESKLTDLRQRTQKPVLLALTGEWESPDVVAACLKHGIRHFHLQWWNGARLTPFLHREGATVFWQVGTRSQAQEAQETGADVLILQGTDAGGQVRSPHTLEELIAQVKDIGLPFIAGGGLATRADAEWVRSLGASAAYYGTRFLLSEEANATPAHKAQLLAATDADLWLDKRLLGEWPCSPRRRLRSEPDEDTPELFAGRGVGQMTTLLPAAEIVRQLDSTPTG